MQWFNFACKPKSDNSRQTVEGCCSRTSINFRASGKFCWILGQPFDWRKRPLSQPKLGQGQSIYSTLHSTWCMVIPGSSRPAVILSSGQVACNDFVHRQRNMIRVIKLNLTRNSFTGISGPYRVVWFTTRKRKTADYGPNKSMFLGLHKSFWRAAQSFRLWWARFCDSSIISGLPNHIRLSSCGQWYTRI